MKRTARWVLLVAILSCGARTGVARNATKAPSAETPIRDLIASFYQGILGRDPEPGAVDSWESGYFDYALGFDIDVRFVPREMGRLFFLSEEYQNRGRADGEFITDCYRVFLDRGPSNSELTAWLMGEWNRSQVMTIFAESEEFANRIDSMYPGLEGNPTRNFVTTMYVGLLDRLVDKGGLEYVAGLFDSAYASGGIEAVRAQAKQMAREVIVSMEFLGKQPTTADYVTRFYRAFLGRFPNDSEVTYWSGTVTGGSLTYHSLISLFADSEEFTARLNAFFGGPTPSPTPSPTLTPTPMSQGPFTVLSPNGGESWDIGSTQTIRWTINEQNSSQIKIQMWYGPPGDFGGSTRITTYVGISPSATSYEWYVDPVLYAPRTNYYINVAVMTGTGEDWSDENFSLVGGHLSVTPSTGFVSSGPEGGPFAPSSATYTLTNIGPVPLDWTTTKTADWIDLAHLLGGWSDGFEDGVIDASLWATGGWRFGVGGIGSGSYTWSHDEIQTADGFLQVRIQGPTSGNSYGATAWVKTQHDFNDGRDYIVNFTWGADVNAHHVDLYAIQIISDYVEKNALNYIGLESATMKILYFAGDLSGGGVGQQDLTPTAWSIKIDGVAERATLYLGPNLTGDLHTSRTLNPDVPWHIGFAHTDATSSGYPGTDNSLYLYSFSVHPVAAMPFSSRITIFDKEGSHGMYGIVPADFDGDGDWDVLCAFTGDDVVSWLENVNGDASAWTERLIASGMGVTEVNLSVADVNRDGRMDVIGGIYNSNKVTWWRNADGKGTSWVENVVDSTFTGAKFVDAADIDGDGDIDLVADCIPGVIAWWENTNRTGTAWTKHTVATGFTNAQYMCARDIDGDGDWDVLGCTDESHNTTWWENTAGDGTAWTAHTVGTESPRPNARVADIDSDGDLDVVEGAIRGDEVCWYENATGGGTTWVRHAVDTSFSGGIVTSIADLDNDGDLDILGGSYSADKVVWWENSDGDGAAWVKHSVDDSFDYPINAYAVDLDGDGDLDFLGAGGVTKQIVWWENQSPRRVATFSAKQIVDGSFGGATSVYAADVDGDGDADVLGSAAADDDIAWWENADGEGASWTEHTVDGTFDYPYTVHAADVDGDGDIDILGSASTDDDVAWWENTNGDGTAWTKTIVDGDFDGAYGVYAADIDGDGDLDVVGGAADRDGPGLTGLVSWWENTAGDGSAWTEHAVDGDYPAFRVYAADVDRDGDLDVLAAGCLADSTDGWITWWENADGGGLAWTEHTVASGVIGAVDVYAADMDRDGDLDVLGADAGDKDITWWENMDGVGTSWTEHPVSGYFDQAYSVYAADLDADGDPDILGAGFHVKEFAWWENADGTATTWVKHTVEDNLYGAVSVFAADVNGDGALDILGAARKANTIAWWENDLHPRAGADWVQATASAPWSGRYAHTSVVHDGKIWVIGGQGPGNKNDVWYSSDGTNWTSATLSAPWSGRGTHSSVVHDGRIWVIGGWDGSNRNDVWYSSDGTSWTQATASVPWSGRSGHSSVVHDGKIWVIGGWDGSSFRNDVWHSSDGVDWTSATLSAPWSARGYHSSVVHDGKIWVIGGDPWSNDVWYSSDGVNWTAATLSAPWSARGQHASVVHDGKIWVIGGDPWSNDVWYSSNGVSWTQATPSASWSARRLHTSVAYGGKIWVIGGLDDGSTYRNDVWYTRANVLGGRLDPGASTTVEVFINANADSLAPGVYTDTVTFTDVTSSISLTRDVELTVLPLPLISIGDASVDERDAGTTQAVFAYRHDCTSPDDRYYYLGFRLLRTQN